MQLGQGTTCYLLDATVSDTAAHVGRVVNLAQHHAHIASFVLVANGTLDGAWLIEGSNDYASGGEQGQPATAGTWVDITALFKQASGSAIAAVAHGTPATQKQFAQAAPLGCRAVRVTFTGSAGTGAVQIIIAGGEY